MLFNVLRGTKDKEDEICAAKMEFLTLSYPDVLSVSNIVNMASLREIYLNIRLTGLMLTC